MRKPTRSIALIRRMIERARRDKVMVALHPDTVEWMAMLTAARTNCVLEPKEAKAVVRLLGVLQGELEVVIDSNLIPEQTDQPKEVVTARRHWKAAEELVAKLTGVSWELKPCRYSGWPGVKS